MIYPPDSLTQCAGCGKTITLKPDDKLPKRCHYCRETPTGLLRRLAVAFSVALACGCASCPRCPCGYEVVKAPGIAEQARISRDSREVERIP